MTSNFAGQPSAETRGMRSEGAKQNRFCAMTCFNCNDAGGAEPLLYESSPARF